MSKSSKLSFKLKRISKSLENFFDPLIYRGYSDQNKLFEVIEVDDAETAIFLNRLQIILKTLITKLEFAATLPKVLGHPKLPEILDKYRYRVVIDAFAPFPKFTEEDMLSIEESNNFTIAEENDTYGLLYKLIAAPSSKSSEIDKESISGEFDDCHRKRCKCDVNSIDPSCKSTEHRVSLHNAIDILMSYPEILEISHSSESISKSSLDFLRQIKFFMEYVLSSTKFTPEEQRANELRIRDLSHRVEQIKLEINDTSDLLNDQKLKNGAELQDLTNELNEAMNTWYHITSQFQEDHANLVKLSLENQAKSKKEFEERMENHRQTLMNMKMRIEAERASNAKEESEVHGKKFKVESQLASIIMKFDSEVGERQEACEDLMREFRALDEDRIQLMKDMEEQLIIHTNIVREREEKASAAFNKKYRKFVRNRAAKVIQRWWRVIYQNIRKKRKKGKKKGKK